MENSHVSIPADKLTLFARLSDLLAQASELAWELSQEVPTDLQAFPIPELKRPQQVPQDQEWFWNNAWQAGERTVNADLKAGHYKTFDTVDDLIADLDSQV